MIISSLLLSAHTLGPRHFRVLVLASSSNHPATKEFRRNAIMLLLDGETRVTHGFSVYISERWCIVVGACKQCRDVKVPHTIFELSFGAKGFWIEDSRVGGENLPVTMSRTVHYVSNRLSMITLDEEEIQKNTQFSKLLLEVSQMLEPGGASVSIHKALEQAQRELRLQRKVWFRSEIIHRLIQEMLVDFQVRKHDGCLSAEESKFYDWLKQCMLVSECSRMLSGNSVSSSDSVSLLGLQKQDLIHGLPSDSNVLQMRDLFQRYLEESLKKKCFTFLSFHQPETDEESDVVCAAKILRLASTLEDEKRRLENEKEKQLELGVTMGKQQEMYPQVLLRCLSLMQEAASDLRLKAQAEIDRINSEYLEAKGTALFLKLRMEELQVLADTYSPEKLEVHRKIRESLETAVKTKKQELATSQQILSSYEFLGPEFEELVQEYTRLKDKIKDNRWMLQELSKTLP
uniref:HAUS augmin like complex subunit 4 n=2 Tax=Leptobrachium leishanense TaxID=445787 RepID=A0A8C5MH53_9ANUR